MISSDTSFLCALYIAQSTSAKALRFMNRQPAALAGTSLLFLHVATALHLGAKEFLTFDGNQKKLAEAEGLVVPL